MKKTVKLIVSSGLYETSAVTVRVTYTTERGLARRVKQLENEYATYGDIATVAVASNKDRWGKNEIIGGQWCVPANGYLTHTPDCFDWLSETDWAHFYAQAETQSKKEKL